MIGVDGLFQFGTEVLKRVWPDANEAERAKMALLLAELDAAHRERVAQIETNTAQAQNPSLFVSGPRPALMWICVGGFGLQYVVYPIWVWAAGIAGWPVPPMPPTSEVIWELTFGMLGLAGMRSWEKSRGVARP